MTGPESHLPPITSAHNGFVRFLQMFKGMWMFTWKEQVTLKKMIQKLPGLLALPFLIWFTLEPGEENHYRLWVVQFYFFMILPIYCLAHMGSMIREEIQNDTIVFLLSRPIRRAELYCLKYFCFMLWLQIWLGIQLLTLSGVGYFLEMPNIYTITVSLFTTQCLAILAWGSLSALFGLLSQKYMVIGIIYGAIVEFGIGRIPTNINNLSFSRHFQTLLAQCPPLANDFNWSPESPIFSIFMICLGAILTLTAGSFLFHYREYHPNSDMSK